MTVWYSRIVIILLIAICLFIFKKIRKFLFLEKRISRYTIHNAKDEISFMDKLDGDEVPLVNSQGVKRKRDIVQFIRFNNFKKNNAINVGNDFAEEVLKEIPTQIEEYYSEVGKFY